MILEVESLQVRYGDVTAVRGVDLAVEAGTALAVLGRNGAGKSSTLRGIAGATMPSGGAVRIDGVDVAARRADDRVRHGIVLIPEGRRLFPHLSVRENLAVGAYLHKLRPAALEQELERVTEHLPRVRERLDQQAGSLSGGEQQLVAIARALMARPRVLMADEPSLGLAPVIVDAIYELFRTLLRDGLTLVVVEQYVGVALALADHAIVIDRGAIALTGPAAELAESPDLWRVYLSGSEEDPT
ncbi:MAG: ABC transporter ATP-binding protein [Acidimicrobiales bacterium]|nr:ABC transporter ATP-binding protein [Acidimicrobiales bacterium]